MLPVRYALRNLARRRARTALTFFGVAVITFLVALMSGFALGLERSASASAADDVAVVVGATGETDLIRSFVPEASATEVAISAPGVVEVDGVRAASVELHTATRVGESIGLLRGVTPAAFLVHRAVVLVEGVEPRAPYELMVGRLAAARMGVPDTALALGRTVRLEGRDWTVSGRFAAPGTVLEAEIWGRLEDVKLATRRVDVSCIALRMASSADFPRVALFASQRQTLEVKARRQSEIYGALRAALAPVAKLAWVMAALVLVGGVFACANTMFAAVLARTREMGALRAIGYGPWSVALSLLEESLLLAGAAGLVGFTFASLVGEFPLRFPMGAFYVDLGSSARFVGLAAAAAVGLLGGIAPAARAVRMPLPDALAGKL
ncbi:MAG: ABC transporter permease [Planctomycetes bacterium]|nr:ABC transporter permease [Planctomycetota bacterium]